MLSVTEITERITQPRGGYLPIKDFQIHRFDDGMTIDVTSPEYSAFASTQGMAVDYLTRFMIGSSPRDAFRIPLMGAAMVSEENIAESLLKRIQGLDEDSISAACSLVSYDVAFRRGTEYYSLSPGLKPSKTIINNIQVMVQRGLTFLERHSPLICSGATFEGGYSSLVSSGDADYLTGDGLWDFKASRTARTSAETLQILLYYIMGVHSVHPEFRSIQTLGLFNPLKNESCEIKVQDIPDLVLRTVSHDVLGLNVPDASGQWWDSKGEDPTVITTFINTLALENTDTGFDPDSYQDGIYDISVNDYWSYYRDKSDWSILRPKFATTEFVKFLKHKGFLMFVSVSSKGSLCVLRGGARKRLEYPLQYYYDRLPEYGNGVLNLLSKYWDALYDVSRYVQHVTEEPGYARVHGCIVDIDFFNHLYLNPYDGTLTPYYADSKYKKMTYQNLASLLAAHKPELLSAFRAAQLLNPASLALTDGTTTHRELALTSQEVTEHNDIVYDTEMYSISDRFKALQLVHDYNLVAVWYDSILSSDALLPAATEAEAKYDAQWDAYIEANLQRYISVEDDERDSSPDMKRFLLWETKGRISQDELFALIRKMLRDCADDIVDKKCVSFCYGWYGTNNAFKYVQVDTLTAEIFQFYKSLLKERKAYQNSVSLRLEITGAEGITVNISADFIGGECPLAVTGQFMFDNGKLQFISK